MHRFSPRLTSSQLAGAVLLLFVAGAGKSNEPVTRGTVALEIDDGRPMAKITVIGPDKMQARGTFLVDTGGGAFIIPEVVAQDVGITWSETFLAEGRELARPDTIPEARLGELLLPLLADRVLIGLGANTGLLPGHVLARHHVIFDYPARTLTLAVPGQIEPFGESIPMPVSEPMGFPRTEIRIGEDTVGMLLDTGPAATIVSEAVIDRWAAAYPEWSHRSGAHGQAAALERAGGQVLSTLVAEQASWAGLDLDPVALAAQRQGVFETYISRMMTAPVVGALGSNVFMDFRLELDYRNETLYVSRPTAE